MLKNIWISVSVWIFSNNKSFSSKEVCCGWHFNLHKSLTRTAKRVILDFYCPLGFFLTLACDKKAVEKCSKNMHGKIFFWIIWLEIIVAFWVLRKYDSGQIFFIHRMSFSWHIHWNVCVFETLLSIGKNDLIVVK